MDLTSVGSALDFNGLNLVSDDSIFYYIYGDIAIIILLDVINIELIAISLEVTSTLFEQLGILMCFSQKNTKMIINM